MEATVGHSPHIKVAAVTVADEIGKHQVISVLPVLIGGEEGGIEMGRTVRGRGWDQARLERVDGIVLEERVDAVVPARRAQDISVRVVEIIQDKRVEDIVPVASDQGHR